MDELIHLLTDWTHWAFEIISGGVFFAAGLLVPEKWNPVKRLVARHDRDKHPQQPQPGQWVCPNIHTDPTEPHKLWFATNPSGVCLTCGSEGQWRPDGG